MARLPVVKNLNVVKDLSPGLLRRMVVPAMNQFYLEGVEEALGRGVIPTIPLPAHTAMATRDFQQCLKCVASLLDPLIRMMN